MKTIRTFFAAALAVALSTMVVSAQSAVQPPSRSVYMSWDNEAQAWDSSSSRIYQYDNFNRVMVENGYRFFEGQSLQNQKIRYTYNSAGQVTEKLEQFIVGGEATAQSRILTEYDMQGRQTSYTHEAWLDSAWQVLRGNKSAYTYGQDNRITEVIESEFNEETKIWEFKNRSVVSYQDGKPHTIQAYKWTDGKWEDDTRMTDLTFFNDVFDTDNARMTSASFQYNIGGIWITVMRLKATFTPDGKELTNSMERLDFMSGKWSVFSKDSSAYDAQGNLTLRSSGYLDEGTETWSTSGERHTYEYNSDNTIHTDITQYLNSEGTEWTNINKMVYFYGGITSVETEDNQTERFTVFPNPASENIVIASAEGEFTLFNQLGQVVLKGSIAGENSRIDASDLQIGQYILQVKTPKGVQSQKVIITR